MKTALITGVAGQDGSYMAELLLGKGYTVHGLVKIENQSGAPSKISHISDRLVLHIGDVSDQMTVYELIKKVRPDEVYHLATKHDLKNSLENYLDIQHTNVDSTYFFLSAIKELKPDCRFFFASSSKVFGRVSSSPQNEQTVFNPNSLYGISKTAGMYLVRMYRDENIFACSGILYNHESPRRDFFFLPRKTTSTAAKIKLGLERELRVGDLNAKRDWGFSGDYVEAMWLMLQQSQPEDFVIGSGEVHTVQELIEVAFKALDLDWHEYVVVDPAFVHSPEKIEMKADITKAKTKLGWSPKVKFKELIQMMAKEDLARAI